jgi:MauM/NapG family ferredoxin protein
MNRRYLRPPGAVAEDEFLKRCIRCRKCVEICPYYSIRVATFSLGQEMGTPVIVPRRIPCYLCLKCPPVCPTGALNPVANREDVQMGVARINTRTCLPYAGVLCRACYERCPIYREAIVLDQEIYPVVRAEKCVGCGICENVCPTDPPSIVVVPERMLKRE